MRNGRYVIAYLLSGLADSFSKSLEIGALKRAEERDIDLIFLPGKFIERKLEAEIKYEYQYNTLFDLITSANVDALIIASDCIGNFTDREHISAFINRFDGIPCVIVAGREEGKPCIIYDNFSGIEAGVTYLTDVMGCTRFAMIGGSEANTDAFERKRSLVTLLTRRGIPFTEDNFIEGNLSRMCTRQAEILLDKNPDVEAVFCVNDETAIALYEVMSKRGLIPGQDIYILGYDNSQVAGQIRPTLSSIWADPAELSAQSVDMALEVLDGHEVPSRLLETMFIRRDSFGTDESHTDLNDMDEQHIEGLYNKIFYRLKDVASDQFKAFKRVIGDCIALINAQEYCPELHFKLKEHFSDALDTGILGYADIELLQSVMDDIYERISEGEGVRRDRNEVRRTYSDIYRMIVGQQQEIIRGIIETDESFDYSLKMVAQDIMRFENGSDQNYSIPLNNLTYMGVRNAFLYMLAEPVLNIDGEPFNAPRSLYLKAVLKDGKVMNITSSKQRISIDDIFANGYMGDERYSIVMLPLFSAEEVYGYFLCDLSPQIMDNGEIIVNQLSAAYRMLYVLGRDQDIMDQLERSNEMLKRNNIMLDGLSKVDQMTGIYNRRGFYEAAEACLEGAWQIGMSVMVMYVDMDNLKLVNDRYGHDEGDFSLKTIVSVLKDIISTDHGVIGRIGGDEFACVVWNDADPVLFKNAISERFRLFNESSDKPYNVTVSAGIYRISDEENRSLEDALSLADEDLYIEKQKRSKQVAK